MRTFIAALILLLSAGSTLAASLEEDVRRYLEIFNGDVSMHSDAADTFPWMGLSDARLFDVIEQRLLREHAIARGDKTEKNRVARYIRALGFSGQPKYEATIRQFLGDRTYERYALAALGDLPRYQRWNPVISNRASFDPKHSDDVNRVMNMLRSDDVALKGIGAKRVYFGEQNGDLLDLLAKELQQSYTATGPAYNDSVAWMLKALGRTKKEKYKPLLQEVYAKAIDPKIKRHADGALRHYNR